MTDDSLTDDSIAWADLSVLSPLGRCRFEISASTTLPKKREIAFKKYDHLHTHTHTYTHTTCDHKYIVRVGKAKAKKTNKDPKS